MDTAYEERASNQGFRAIAGIDEAGRGPLAGPVVAAACILPKYFDICGINDSKKLTPQKRNQLFATLTGNPNISYGVGIVHSTEIDCINILQATFVAMLNAVKALPIKPDYLLVDGPMLPRTDVPGEAIIGGDSLSLSIAAASIIAKVIRDRMMCDYHEQWPQYGFDQHKGYGTDFHLKALAICGPCPIHRISFSPLKQLSGAKSN